MLGNTRLGDNQLALDSGVNLTFSSKGTFLLNGSTLMAVIHQNSSSGTILFSGTSKYVFTVTSYTPRYQLPFPPNSTNRIIKQSLIINATKNTYNAPVLASDVTNIKTKIMSNINAI